jgi:hypothetical protein
MPEELLGPPKRLGRHLRDATGVYLDGISLRFETKEKLMKRPWTCGISAVLVALVTLAPASAQEVVLSVRSYEDLLGDVKYVLKMANLEDRAQQIEGMLALLGAGNQPSGIDTKKPFGIYIREYVDEGAETPMVIFLPVTKPEEFLDLLRQVGMEPGKPDEGIYTLDTPLGISLHLRFAHDYAYMSPQPENVKGNLPEPAKFLPAANKKNLIALTARIDQMPAKVKRQMVQDLAVQRIEDALKRDDETEEQYRTRLAVSKALSDVLTMFVEEGKDLSASINVDHKAGAVSVEIQATAKGSQLAQRIQEFAPVGGIAPVHLEISVGKILKMFASRDAEQQAQLKELLGDDKAAKDTIKLTLGGGDAARLRLEVGGVALRVFAALMPSELEQ